MKLMLIMRATDEAKAAYENADFAGHEDNEFLRKEEGWREQQAGA